jgi:hypothetical protein
MPSLQTKGERHVPDTKAARSKAIISMLLALPGIETAECPSDATLSRRFTQGDDELVPPIPGKILPPHCRQRAKQEC